MDELTGKSVEERERAGRIENVRRSLLSPPITGASTTTLPAVLISPVTPVAPMLGTGDRRGVELDQSVLVLSRPGKGTESMPSSPLLSPTEHSYFPAIPKLESIAQSNPEDNVAKDTLQNSMLKPLEENSSTAPHTPRLSKPAMAPRANTFDGPPSPTIVKSPLHNTAIGLSLKPPTAPNGSATASSSTSQQPARRRRAGSTASVATFHGGGAESIFRLLPRECRPALRRMLHLEPGSRCTLEELIGPLSALYHPSCTCAPVIEKVGKCLCHEPGRHEEEVEKAEEGKENEEEDVDDEEEEDVGEDGEKRDGTDPWLMAIMPCSIEGEAPQHVHIKIPVDEKAHKRRFF
jgi:hypothetical protein